MEQMGRQCRRKAGDLERDRERENEREFGEKMELKAVGSMDDVGMSE